MNFLTKLFKSKKPIDISETALSFTKMNKFRFYKEELQSMDYLLKGITQKDINNQKDIFNGIPTELKEWNKKCIYFQEQSIDLDSSMYQNFVDELLQAYIINNNKLIMELLKYKDYNITYKKGNLKDSPLKEKNVILTLKKLTNLINSDF